MAAVDKAPNMSSSVGNKSFQMRPALEDTFQTAKVKQIIQGILNETLSGELNARRELTVITNKTLPNR